MTTPSQPGQTNNIKPSDVLPTSENEAQDNTGWMGVRDASGTLLYKYQKNNPLILQLFVRGKNGKKRLVQVDHAKAVSGSGNIGR